MGMDRKIAVWLVSTIGLTNTFGRVICGWISSYESVDAIVLNNVSLTFGGLYTVLLPFLPYSMVSYYLYASLFGFSMGEHHGFTHISYITCTLNIVVMQYLNLIKYNFFLQIKSSSYLLVYRVEINYKIDISLPYTTVQLSK